MKKDRKADTGSGFNHASLGGGFSLASSYENIKELTKTRVVKVIRKQDWKPSIFKLLRISSV